MFFSCFFGVGAGPFCFFLLLYSSYNLIINNLSKSGPRDVLLDASFVAGFEIFKVFDIVAYLFTGFVKK